MDSKATRQAKQSRIKTDLNHGFHGELLYTLVSASTESTDVFVCRIPQDYVYLLFRLCKYKTTVGATPVCLADRQVS